MWEDNWEDNWEDALGGRNWASGYMSGLRFGVLGMSLSPLNCVSGASNMSFKVTWGRSRWSSDLARTYIIGLGFKLGHEGPKAERLLNTMSTTICVYR